MIRFAAGRSEPIAFPSIEARTTVQIVKPWIGVYLDKMDGRVGL
jgi:hypothetical protein